MLHIKFDQDWPTGFRDIQVWNCGRRTTDDDGRRTIGILQVHPVSLRLRWAKKWRHYFLHYKSMGNKFRAQGRITPKQIIRSGPNSNSLELLCLSSLPVSLTKIQWKVTKKSWIHHCFTAQGHITPKWLIRYDQNLNSSEILCLSSLPVRLMKTEFIVTEKRWRHHFPQSKSVGTLKGK